MADKTRWHRALWEGQLPDLGISYVPDPDHPTGGIQCLGYTTPGIGEARARRWLATYYGMISLIDHHVGRLLTGLDALGLTRDTIVLFTTDHGEYAGNHGLWLKGPLHYEDIIRVPFIVRWPGVVPANVRSESLISLVDVAPTLLDVIGCSVPVTMQGVSQRETWRNPAHACRSWCLVENRAEPSVYVKSLVTPRYKLNYFLGWGEGELYDLQEDPHEFVNLYHTSGVATTVQPDLFRQLVDITGSLENPYPPRRAFA